MNFLTTEERAVKRRSLANVSFTERLESVARSQNKGCAVKQDRLTIAEFSERLENVARSQNKVMASLMDDSGVKENCKESSKATNMYFSKAAACVAPDKILALLKQYPEWGTKRLAKSLAEQGVFLSRQSIHKILVKYNLNLPSMRKAWWANQKEINP
jgi:hypothetical protein